VTELGALEGREVAENNRACDCVDVTGSSKYLLPLLTRPLPTDRLYFPIDFL
jgi:hypothetical protein